MKFTKTMVLILGLTGFAFVPGIRAQTPEPVVHAVFFYSPTCAHCHQLITEYLAPLQEQYGRSLVLLALDTSQPWANNLYWETIRHFELPEEDWAVPMMVLGQEVLLGGIDIPARLTPVLEEGLAGDGVDLPDYPPLINFLREQDALDLRYPDRLIAKRAPAPEDSVAESSGAVADSSEAVDEVAGVVDEVVGAGDPENVDSLAAAAAAAAVEEGSGVPQNEAGTPVAEDSGAVADPVQARDVVSPEVETGGDAADSAELALPAGGGVEETTPAAVQDDDSGGPQGAVGAVDLGEIAREMESMTMLDRFNLDRAGNSLSVLVLLVMILSLALKGYLPRVRGGEWPAWVIPALVIAGVGVAGYLSFIEVTHSEAVCGPVGDCNTVNQSKYAYLFGVLPVGILGLMGYGVILLLWLVKRLGSGTLAARAALGLWGAAVFGVLFSVYLTFLEPFVIGATCAWCLTSAIVMTLLLWASAPPAKESWLEAQPASST